MIDYRESIPSKFYRGDEEKPVAFDVGGLIKILQQLPPELELDEAYQVVVYNIKNDPIVAVQEHDDEDDWDEEE